MCWDTSISFFFFFSDCIYFLCFIFFYGFQAITISQKFSEDFTLKMIQKLQKIIFGFSSQALSLSFVALESDIASRVINAGYVVNFQFIFTLICFG